MRYPLAFFLLMLLSTCVPAQEMDVAELNLSRIDHQRTAMLVLGGWAVGNVGLGLALRGGSTGEMRRFHEMNAIWNTVNLGIAAFGYYTALRENPTALDAFAGLQKNGGFQKVLLFNAGLDVGYVLGGLYLTERARRPEVDSDQLRGYGKSIMLQGGFLLLFDLANYFIASGRDDDYRLLLGAVGEGVGLQYAF